MSPQYYYNQLTTWTLNLEDPEFIHQYIVDAFCAQNADESTKPIALTFALVGLYLHFEKGYTGRQAQLAHIKMAQAKKDWPKFELPKDRGSITAEDVLKVPDYEKKEMIEKWARSVWAAYSSIHNQVADLALSEKV